MEQAAVAGTRAVGPAPSPAEPGPSPTASPTQPGGGAPTGMPTAVKFAGIPTVGTLFYTTGTQKHFCTASVADSHPGDLVLTAAHCVYATRYAANVTYVPQYHDGLRPYGIWPVKAMLVPTRWKTAHDPNYDFAFLALATVSKHPVQAVTKGLTLGLNGSYAEAIEAIGYNNSDDEPVQCLTKSFKFRTGQQEFYCHDFWMGTSGGPWITGLNATTGTGTVHGVIGGYQAGGDYEWASYSAYFGSHIAALYLAAEKIR
jgi:V8-like Glu-specific endopeptidase